ncbi:threonine--tRNA ligase [Patescibacteria group bacterium]|nr:threonine--tRNA ligase [Patescibacteria group bacterium]MBU4367743.1 threonine--tRNA ligase [Patescibacteria group bacterium]MBU4461807.1 threonine--tRNA ligase [Patescibacteria group bacterium]MCG2700062.1 threonine--tRNA ligase [Candidatus Parcubacteria bacterium]
MNIETIRHSLAHIMAYAFQELHPGIKFGIGPAIDNGFYYDFSIQIPEEELPKIEKKMRELINQNIVFKKKLVSKQEAKKIFKKQPYKLELIAELQEKKASVYESGKFVDLCKGPHIKSTKEIKADSFKLTKVAGAYWRGDEKNPMLTRIYGVAFSIKKELDDYLKLQAEAEKRDHRVLGKKLDLFVFSDLVGKGLPLYTEKGSIIRRELENFVVNEEIKRGYKHVYTPDLAKVELYKVSGHYPYYKDTMYPIMKVDEDELILRPMTCPHHYQLYLSKQHSYKELPLRIAELAKQFRYEKSGELSGLMRTRMFCLADAHIICQKEKASEEINNVLDLIEFTASALGLEKDFRYRLSLGDRKDNKKYYKDDKAWSFAENVLRSILKKRNIPFFEAKKEAAFYGPKIDIQMKNFIGKEDTAFTVQYDFVGPKRFNLFYIDKNGVKKEPIVIHRSSIGAIERTIAFLLEKYAGALPLWLSPVQSWVIPIGSDHNKYAKKVYDELINNGVRAEIKNDNETVSKKIRNGQIQKIPYLLVVGDKEIKAKSVAVRKRGENNIETIKLDKFIENIKKEILNKI